MPSQQPGTVKTQKKHRRKPLGSKPYKNPRAASTANEGLFSINLHYRSMTMAVLMRRAFSSCSIVVRNARYLSILSHSPSLGSCNSIAETSILNRQTLLTHLSSNFRIEQRREFAKGRKSKDDNDGTVEVMPDIGPSVKAATLAQMEAAIDSLSRELSKLRSGRASTGMLDHIIVEMNGLRSSLSRIAVVSVMDSKTLSVTPYDCNTLKEIEKAIVSSPLGLNPTVEGERLVAAIPPLTKEHIQALCKVVAKASEDVKQSIRRARQNALNQVKKAASSIPKDDVKRLEKEVEEVTKKFVKSAEDMCKAKEKEILSS